MSEDSEQPLPLGDKDPIVRLSPEVYAFGLSAVRSVIDQIGATPVRVQDDDRYEDSGLPPETEVGKTAVVTGFTGQISYKVELSFFNEARGVNPTYSDVAYIGINAAPGEVEDRASLGQGRVDGPQIAGLIAFASDGTCDADLDHGTTKSDDPRVQEAFEDLVYKFGLEPSIFEGKRRLSYDDETMHQLISNISTLADRTS